MAKGFFSRLGDLLSVRNTETGSIVDAPTGNEKAVLRDNTVYDSKTGNATHHISGRDVLDSAGNKVAYIDIFGTVRDASTGEEIGHESDL